MTIFQKIIDKEIPADIVYEDDQLLAFRDINPQAPVHILVIPKKPIERLSDMEEADIPLIGALMYRATRIAEDQGITDYRLTINTGPSAGQTVYHIHLHLMAGRNFMWPPG